MLVDTHAHLYWDSYKEDLNEVLERSIEAGVTTIISVGVDVKLSKRALKQVQGKLAGFPNLTAYSTIGIHPHEALRYTQGKLPDLDVSIHQDIERLEEIYQNSAGKAVAVGECGLDFVEADKQVKQLQRQLFQAQIDLAKKLNLPLIVHCRDDRGSTNSPPAETSSPSAWDEVIEMIGSHPTILHCYSGLLHTTYSILHTPNLIVSFAATITYPKNEYLREAAKILPLEKIVLETDCPFLPPQSKRGERNEPAAILEIARLIAQLKGVSLDEVAKQTTANATEILRLRSG